MCHRKMGKEQEHTVKGMGNGMWVAVKGQVHNQEGSHWWMKDKWIFLHKEKVVSNKGNYRESVIK